MQRSSPKRRHLLIAAYIVAGIALLLQVGFISTAQASSRSTAQVSAAKVNVGDWQTYASNNQRTGFNGSESILNASNVANLQLKWSQFTANGISAQPIEVNGVVYWGSWDGFFHAFTTSGQHLWDTQLGTTTASGCDPVSAGVASTATFGAIGATPVIFVGGGNARFYALNATNGHVIWSLSSGSSPSHFIWSSPLVANGSVYIGVSSFGDCPLVQGQLLKVNAATGAMQAVFNVAPVGCTGNSIWGSPSLDPSGSIVYVATGNAGACSKPEPYGESIVALNAANLGVIKYWSVPANQGAGDVDFGTTPIVFDMNGKHYLGAANKNGLYYMFNRDNISAGPIWEKRIANNTVDCPQCGDGSIVPSAWGGSRLYIAGGKTTINPTTTCAGSVMALNPSSGALIWQRCFQGGPVLGAITLINGVVTVTQGQNINVLDSTTGVSLFTYQDNNHGSFFYGSASISHGQMFVGNMDGSLYAFGLPSSIPTPTPSPTPAPNGYNNIGVSDDTAITSANYDGAGSSYSAQALAADGIIPGNVVTAAKFAFTWPNVSSGTSDNYLAAGQTIAVTPVNQADHLGILGAAANGATSGTGTITYTDNTTQSFTLGLTDWASSTPAFGNTVAATMPYRNTNVGRQTLTINLFTSSVALTAGKTLQSVTLPATVSGGQLHIFALSTSSQTAPVYNNVGVTSDSNISPGNYDGAGDSYSEQALQSVGLTAGGNASDPGKTMNFVWPGVAGGNADNYQASGQTLSVTPGGTVTQLGFLGSASNGPTSGTATITYSDNTTQTFTLGFSDWTLAASKVAPSFGNTIAYSAPYRSNPHVGNGQETLKTYIFFASVNLQAGKTITSVTLPTTVTGGQLHVFAVGTK